MNIREEISKYLLTNPIDRTKKDPYGETANKFGVSTEVIRCQWRKLRNKGQAEDKERLFVQYKKAERNSSEDKFSQTGNIAEVSKVVNRRVKTLGDLIEICEIDLKVWEIISWECNKWEVGIRTDDGDVQVEPLFQVKAKLKIRTADEDLGLQKELILKELKEYSPKVEKFEPTDLGECLLELAVPDLHLGSLVWHEETGDNYDLKVAEKRFKASIQALLGRVNISTIGKILLPIGNDFLNVDNKNNSTSNGTVVDTDCRFMKMVKAAKRILIETIDSLSAIAPVDVVVVPGNHDYTSSLMIGEILDSFYHNNDKVSIDNSLKSRKYYKFGKVGIQLTHGDEEKHAELGLIFATEEPQIWAATKFRFCQLGHHHKNKKTNHISVNEFPGFQIQILPTLSSRTAWAYKKGYASLMQAKAFLYHPTEGEIAEYTYSV